MEAEMTAGLHGEKKSELKEHEREDKDDFGKLCSRLDAVEKHLGINQKKKSKDEILRERRRS